MLFTDASYMPGRLSRSAGMNKMGLAQDNTIILLKKLQFGENRIFWEKKRFWQPHACRGHR